MPLLYNFEYEWCNSNYSTHIQNFCKMALFFGGGVGGGGSTIGLFFTVTVCCITSALGEFWSGGGSASSVASLCRIMSSLLKMTSLTPETDSKTAIPAPAGTSG